MASKRATGTGRRPITPRWQEVPAAVISVRTVYWSAIGLAVLAVFATMWLVVDPAPPDRITIATGPPDSFYERLGRRFAVALERQGVKVDLVETAGAPENLALLREGDGIGATFVQGGVGSPPPQDTNLRSLAALGIEPVWIFARDAASLSELEEGGPIRMAMGPPGSGTRDFMFQLLAVTGLDSRVEPSDLDGEEAAQALLAGKVDVAAFLTSPRTHWVLELIENPAVKLVDFRDSDALTRLIPFASRVFLPARVIDYPNRVPASDIDTLGVATIMMVRDELHPAVKQLLLQVSTQVVRGNTVYGPDSRITLNLEDGPVDVLSLKSAKDLNVVRGDAILGTIGEFPSARLVEYPLDAEAERFFRYGPTPARLYLPFWAANLVERFWVLVIPVVTLLIPLLRFGPSTLGWSLRRRVYRWYKDLHELELEAEDASTESEIEKVLDGLRTLEGQVMEIRVPLMFRDDVYRLRTHIAFVRTGLTQPR